MQTLTIFISSPGDVQDERTVAGRVIERLQGKYWSFIRLDDVFWEYKAVRATAHYQDELMNPGQCDLVLGILWTRLGSPLPDRFRNANGEVMTGTEWELEEAFAAYEHSLAISGEAGATPDILVYRRLAGRIPQDDPSMEAAAAECETQLNDYLQREYFFANGTIKRPVLAYQLDDFENKLFAHLEQLILKRIPKLKAGYEPPPISGSPFKNLKHFDFCDADRFFGRNRAIREVQSRMIDQVKNHHAAFVLIYGASGYGKSSLMRAGLAPALTRPGALADKPWRRVIMLPQGLENGPLCEQLARAILTSPTADDLAMAQTLAHWPLPGLSELDSHAWDIAAFARALADPERLAFATAAIATALTTLDRHLLLQIDQLEESFTHESITDADRENFFRAIDSLSRCGRVWTLATMRSEFFPSISTQNSLHQLIQRGGGYILQPASDQELREIIRYPAFAARLGFERLIVPRQIGESLTLAESLDDQILLDAKGSQDALPLLEFTLHQLYSAIAPAGESLPRQGDLLLWDTYVEIGGLQGSIATVADNTFHSLRLHEQLARDQIFGNLVQVDAGGSDTVTRMRTPLEKLIRSTPGAEGFVNAFRQNNLLIADEDPSSGETVITLAHESLLSYWPVLCEWVKDHRGILRGRQRLREHCGQWIEAKRIDSREKGKRPADYLLEGGRLAEADEVVSSGNFTDITLDEKQLISDSRKASNRRMRFFQVASMVFGLLAIGAGALGWVANQRKKEATTARDQALVSEQSALRARGTAEGLINSMLFDLRDKLAPIGRVELLDDVSKQAEDYFRNNPSTTAAALRNEGTMWGNRGTVLQKTGDLKAAREAYEKGLEIMNRLFEANPSDIGAQRDLAVTYFKLGGLLQEAGELKAARVVFEKDLKIYRHLIEGDPDNGLLLRDLSVCYERLGDQSRIEGDLKGAREAFEKGFEITQRLAEGDPDNAQAQRDLSMRYDRLADVAQVEGNLVAAREGFEKSLDILRRLADADPQNAMIQGELSVIYDRLGVVAQAEGNLKAQRAAYEKCLEIDKRLAAADPRNAEVQRDLGISYSMCGEIAIAEGDLKAARESYEMSLEIFKHLAKSDPRNAKTQQHLSFCYDGLGVTAQAAGDLKAARVAYEKGFEIAKRLVEAEPRNAEAKQDLSLRYNRLGELAQAEGDLKGARLAYEKAFEVTNRLAEADPRNTKVQRELSLRYNRLGCLAHLECDPKVARAAFRKCLEIDKRLAEANPRNVEVMRSLSASYSKIGDVATADGDLIEAREAYQERLAIDKQLGELNPADTGTQRDLGISYETMGAIAQSEGDLKSAREPFERSLEIFMRLADADRSNAQWQRDAVLSLLKISQFEDAENFPAAAKAHRQQCYHILRRMEQAPMKLDPFINKHFEELKVEFGSN